MRNEKISLRHFTKAKMHFARWKRVPSPPHSWRAKQRNKQAITRRGFHSKATERLRSLLFA